MESYANSLGSWVVQTLNLSNGKLFSPRPRDGVHDVGTVVHVESRVRLVGVRWTRAIREGGAITVRGIGRGNQWQVGVHVQMISSWREVFHVCIGVYGK